MQVLYVAEGEGGMLCSGAEVSREREEMTWGSEGDNQENVKLRM